MVKQEKPEFFSCNCSKGHYCIEVTDEMRQRAQNLSDIDNMDENTLIPPGKEESQFEKLAEIVAYELLSDMGVSITYTNQGWKEDFSVNKKKAHVKALDYTQTDSEDADLLIRDGEDNTYSPDDVNIIIQVMLDGLDSNKGYVAGYFPESEVEDAPVFQDKQTRRVPHKELHSLEDLV